MRCRTSPLLALAGSVTLILAIIPAMSAGVCGARADGYSSAHNDPQHLRGSCCAEPASVAKKFVQAHFDVPAPAKRATSGESISGTTYHVAGARTWLGSASESGPLLPSLSPSTAEPLPDFSRNSIFAKRPCVSTHVSARGCCAIAAMFARRKEGSR